MVSDEKLAFAFLTLKLSIDDVKGIFKEAEFFTNGSKVCTISSQTKIWLSIVKFYFWLIIVSDKMHCREH